MRVAALLALLLASPFDSTNAAFARDVGLAQGKPAVAGLRIVVIEGEGAVNIIQQKTAVAPIVEVRDRNNLPVPGAVVTFSLGGPGASFGGASTLAVTTNAAGQAVATGFTPTAAGAIHINAAAAFQGQTAIASITQTNVMTAAQAAAAGSGASGASSASGGSGSGASGASSASGAAGGGISATTLGIVGGAVAGGVVAAEKLDVIGGKPTYEGRVTVEIQLRNAAPQPGAPSCFSLITYTAPVTIELDVSGDSVSGRFKMKGTVHATNGTCAPFPSGTNPADVEEGVEGAIGGTKSSIAFSDTKTFTGDQNTNNVHITKFVGALNGDSIAGTVTMDWTLTGQGVQSVGVGSGAVTLTKQ